MKNIFKNLFSTKNFFSINYLYDAKEGLVKTDDSLKKQKIAQVCMVSRKDYWHAERSYKANLIDLPKIIMAEIKTIAPFEGRVFWQIKKLSTTESIINYAVIPQAYIDLISEQCQFIYPLNLDRKILTLGSENTSVSEGSIDKKTNENLVGEQSIWQLLGFFIVKKSGAIKQQQKLPTKYLVLSMLAVVALFTFASSAYLNFTQSHYEQAIFANKQAVEHALIVQREVKSQYQSKLEFEQFTTDNKNVLAILGSFNFDELDYVITQVHLHPKGVKLTGSSVTSATDLLTAIVNNVHVKEAKFSRPVTKNRQLEDDFTIEVVFI